jgi:hypothetical protein
MEDKTMERVYIISARQNERYALLYGELTGGRKSKLVPEPYREVPTPDGDRVSPKSAEIQHWDSVA